MFQKIFNRKAITTPAATVKENEPRIIRHPLTREQAQERGAKGNEMKRQLRLIEALTILAVREKSPLLGALADAHPKLAKDIIRNKPEMLEALLKIVDQKKGITKDTRDTSHPVRFKFDV